MNGVICCITGTCSVGFGISIQSELNVLTLQSKRNPWLLYCVCLMIPDLPLLQQLGKWLNVVFFRMLQLTVKWRSKDGLKDGSNISNFLFWNKHHSLLSYITIKDTVHISAVKFRCSSVTHTPSFSDKQPEQVTKCQGSDLSLQNLAIIQAII